MKISFYIKQLRPAFFTASLVPILVGTALAYLHRQAFDPVIFILALVSITAIQGAANALNDYFDHRSGCDWKNTNPTPFSGGSQLIQKGSLAPGETLAVGIVSLVIGIAAGIGVYLMTTRFVLILGIIGVAGAVLYTAEPFKLGYRTFGEILIALLFGILPVYGAYHIQTGSINSMPLLPGTIVGLLILLVIFANEFPDYKADRQADKKTLVVALGIRKAALLFKCLLFILALVIFLTAITFGHIAPRLILITISAIMIVRTAGKIKIENLETPGHTELSQATIQMHLIIGLLLAGTFLITDAMG